jgi:hypothetical protein
MVSTQVKESQALLFSEPFFTETGVWCELSDGLDPKEWASLCRSIGSLSPKELRRVRKKIHPDPDSIFNRFQRLFVFEEWETAGVPLVCFDPAGINKR